MAPTFKENNNEDRVPPIRITDEKTGTVYELDFDRASIKFAEDRGFELDNVTRFPVTNLPLLFFYSFRYHHREVSKRKTDELYERLGGLSPAFIERLILLYAQAQQSNNIVDSDEEMGKNGSLTVEL